MMANPGRNTAGDHDRRGGRSAERGVPSQGPGCHPRGPGVRNQADPVHSNPGDEAVTIPRFGFNINATLTRPIGARQGRFLGDPAERVGASDRDGGMSWYPGMGQLASALANSGFMTVRYDKRGYGQSGGRPSPRGSVTTPMTPGP